MTHIELNDTIFRKRSVSTTRNNREFSKIGRDEVRYQVRDSKPKVLTKDGYRHDRKGQKEAPAFST